MSRRHILLVEDDEDDRLMLSHVVQKVLRHGLTAAADGLEAIRLASENQFDLVLLDVRLPNLQGWDVAAALRAMEGYRKVPIVAVTAYDLPEARQRLRKSGCDSFVVKPVDVDGLAALVTRLLGT